jgi:hypothetical protein
MEKISEKSISDKMFALGIVIFLGLVFLLSTWCLNRTEPIDMVNRIYLTKYGQMDFINLTTNDIRKLIPDGPYRQEDMVTLKDDVTIRGYKFWMSDGHLYRIIVADNCSDLRNVQMAYHWVRLRNEDVLANFRGNLFVTFKNNKELAKAFSISEQKAGEVWNNTCKNNQ